MKKILAFAGSNSDHSLNRHLLNYTASLIDDHEVTVFDIRELDLPVYDIDVENESGVPEQVLAFAKLFEEHDGFIFACPEHNGFMPAVMKNIIDWVSRVSRPIWQNKPLFLMATSPGARGGSWNLENLAEGFSYRGGIISGKFSLPNFHDNFDKEIGSISDPTLCEEHLNQLAVFLQALKDVEA